MAFNFLRKKILQKPIIENINKELPDITAHNYSKSSNNEKLTSQDEKGSERSRNSLTSEYGSALSLFGGEDKATDVIGIFKGGEDLPTETTEEICTTVNESSEEEPTIHPSISDFKITDEKLEDAYKNFIETMQSKTAPDIVKSCYLVSGYSKICIEVSNGNLDKATCFFQGIFPDLIDKDIIDIFEEGIYHLVSPPDLTSDPEDEATGKIVKEPGKQLECIQTGSTVMVGGDTATVAMLARDINNSDKPYAITVSHVFSRKPEYVIGIKDSFSFIHNQEESIHIGSLYYGVISSLSVTYPDSDQHKPTRSPTITQLPHYGLQQNRPEVDIAAIPLNEKLIDSLLIEKQIKRGFTFEVFTGINEVPLRSRVEIFGSRSGTRKGYVYPFKQNYKFVNGKMVKKQDYIAVISESLTQDHLFCRSGDSGSLVIDDITSHEAEVYQAYGILFKVNYKFKDKSLPGFPERRLALFVRLDNCFNEMNRKWGIDLRLYTHNQEHPGAAISDATMPRTSIVPGPEENADNEYVLNPEASITTPQPDNNPECLFNPNVSTKSQYTDSKPKKASSPKNAKKPGMKSSITLNPSNIKENCENLLKTRSIRRVYPVTSHQQLQ